MRELNLHRERTRLEAIRGLAPDATDPQKQSHFARYYCVLVCGFIENCIKIVVIDFAQNSGRSEVAAYVGSRISRFGDIGKQELSSFIHSYSNTWGKHVDSFMDGPAGEALDSLKNIRNQVAHGGSMSTSLGQIDAYFSEIDKLVEFVDKTFR